MIAVVVLLTIVAAGILGFATALPLIIAFPLIVVALCCGALLSAELYRRWQQQEAARAMVRLRARVIAARRTA
jgi:heme O synthase-like polyprenyltransferase